MMNAIDDWRDCRDPARMMRYNLETPRSDSGVRHAPSARKLALAAVACLRHVSPDREGDVRAVAPSVEHWADGGKRPSREPLWRAIFAFGRFVRRKSKHKIDTDRAFMLYHLANADPLNAFRFFFADTRCGEPERVAQILRDTWGDDPHGTPSLKGWRLSDSNPPDQDWGGEDVPMLKREGRAVNKFLTPQIRDLALAAYRERDRPCPRCEWLKTQSRRGGDDSERVACPQCGGEGVSRDGSLDPVRLSVLADALEELGYPDEDILMLLRGNVRCRADARSYYGGWVRAVAPRYRGFWPLDLLLEM